METQELHFMYLVVHELRTPLSAIKSSADLLSFYKEMDDRHTILQIGEHIGRIQTEAEKLNRMLDGLLLLAKIEAGKIKQNQKPADILSVVNNTISAQNAMQSDGRNSSLSITGLPVKIIFEEEQLERILDNLLSNAFKYSGGNPPPELQVHFTGSSVRIIVKDFGIGIPEDEQHLVHNSFFRASNAENADGIGLGLVIVRRLVNLNGGDMQFTSIENEGSEFTISFPYPEGNAYP